MPLIIAFLAGMVLAWWLLRQRTDARPSQPTPPPMRTVVDPDIEALVLEGKRIDAIKRYRELHGGSLADATAAINQLEDLIQRR